MSIVKPQASAQPKFKVGDRVRFKNKDRLSINESEGQIFTIYNAKEIKSELTGNTWSCCTLSHFYLELVEGNKDYQEELTPQEHKALGLGGPCICDLHTVILRTGCACGGL